MDCNGVVLGAVMLDDFLRVGEAVSLKKSSESEGPKTQYELKGVIASVPSGGRVELSGT